MDKEVLIILRCLTKFLRSIRQFIRLLQLPRNGRNLINFIMDVYLTIASGKTMMLSMRGQGIV